MRLVRSFERELRCADGRFILIFALGSLLFGMLSALLGRGHALYYHICLPRFAPSSLGLWIIWTFFYLAIGAAAGIVLSAGRCCRRNVRRSGIVWWSIVMALGFLWFPCFFGAGRFLLSLLLIPLMILASFQTIRGFIRISLLSALVMVLYAVWLFFCFFLQVAVILCN